MGKVYRNFKDMDVPSIGFVDRHDGRVFIVITDEEGKKRRKTIGHLTDSSVGQEKMVPNDYFRNVYQDLFLQAYPNQKIPAHEMSIGLYAITLGISETTGLYSILQDIYGTQDVNSILDYAMYSIAFMSCTTQLFEEYMKNKVLFSDKLHTDSWYSVLFAKMLTEDQHHLFRIKWIEKLAKNGLKKVWLGIDGSNNDCVARQTYLAKYGFPKSHNKNKTIVGFMYAVDADTGRPVTYFTYEGSVPDCQAFQKIATFLGSFNIEIEGVILDRGFAVEEVFKKIESENWKYVVMLPTDTDGHKKMFQEHSEEIRWKSKYLLEDEVLFGVSDSKKLFRAHERISNICLFFDGGGGSKQSIVLSKKIQNAKKKAKAAILNGKKAGIPSGLQKYLSIEGIGSDRKVVEHFDEWDKAMESKGFFSMAVSDDISPQKANEIYRKRDTSETQFSILKSQEGGDTTRVHKTEGIFSKYALSFISSIIRFEIQNSCKKIELDTNPTIQGLEHVSLLYTAEGKYEAVRNLTTEQKELYKFYGLGHDNLERMAQDFNKRNRNDSKNPVRKLPESDVPIAKQNTHKRGRPSLKNSNDTIVIEKGDNQDDIGNNSSVKSKGGRPKGRKDSQPRKPRSDKGKKRGKRKAST